VAKAGRTPRPALIARAAHIGTVATCRACAREAGIHKLAGMEALRPGHRGLPVVEKVGQVDKTPP